MSHSLYRTRSKVVEFDRLPRRGQLETWQDFDIGVHRSLAEHFGLQVDKSLPLPVDYIVTAAAS